MLSFGTEAETAALEALVSPGGMRAAFLVSISLVMPSTINKYLALNKMDFPYFFRKGLVVKD